MIHTSSPEVNAVADVVNQLVDPWRSAPPPEQGAAGQVSRVLGTLTGLVGAPAMIIDQAIGVGVGSLASALGLPPFPALPAATLGTAMHIGSPHVHGHPPSLVPPAPPIPLPSIGMPVLSGCISVLINGMPALRAGDLGPGLTCGSLFPPLEIITGSSSVYIGGARAARMGDMTRHCNPMETGTFDKVMAALGALAGAVNAVGALNEMGAADARATAAQSAGEAANAAAEASGKALAAGMAAAQVAADAAAFAMRLLCGKDPGGPPGFGSVIAIPGTVQIGGFPMPNIGDFIMGKVFEKIARLARRLRPRGTHPEANGTHCNGTEPVDIITGQNFSDYLDFVSPAGFRFERFYRSSRNREAGPMGWSMRHSLQHELRVRLHHCVYRAPDGYEVTFPRFPKGTMRVSRFGFVLERTDGDRYRVSCRNRPYAEFVAKPFVTAASLVRIGSEEARWSLEPEYLDGRLTGWSEFSAEGVRKYVVGDDAHGRIEGIFEVGRGFMSAERVPRGTYAYDRGGRMSAVRDALGHEERYEYDETNRLTRWTDKRRYSFAWRYDAQGRCVWASGEDGLWHSEFEYLPERSCTKVTTEPGAVWTYEYDAADNVLLRIEDPYGGEFLRRRNVDGLVVEEKDWGGRSWSLQYDRDGGHVGRVDPFGNTLPTQNEMPRPPEPVPRLLPDTPREHLYGGFFAHRDPSVRGLDARWRTVVPDRLQVEADRVFTWTSAKLDKPRLATRNAMGRTTRVEGAFGDAQRWEYDETGNETLHTDAEDRSWRSETTRWNLVGARIDPLGHRTRFEHTARERVAAVIDAGGARSEYRYDGKDRLVEVWRHGVCRERYGYDAKDRLIEKRDGAGRPLLSVEPHASGMPGRVELAGGEVLSFDYDERGRPTKVVSAAASVEMRRDGLLRRLYDLRDGRGVLHRYGARSLERTIILGRYEVTFERTREDEFAVHSPTGAIAYVRHGSDGGVFRRSFGGTRELAQYDKAGRLNGRVCWHANGRMWSARYVRNRAGELVRIEDSERGLTYFERDGAGRLAARVRGAGTRTDYPLDAAGNLVSMPGAGGIALDEGNRLRRAGDEEFVYNDRNHVALRRSARGTWFYRYDSLDRLVEAHWEGAAGEQHAWRAEYDGLGRRVSKEWRGERWEYWWDGDRLAAECSPAGKLRLYLYAGPEALAPIGLVVYPNENTAPSEGRTLGIFHDASGMPLWIENDLGAIRWLADDVEPYGTVSVASHSALSYDGRWPGHWYDSELGLHYNRFRYFDPRLGRYLQSDPLGVAGGVNLYAAPTNPLDCVDLLGLTHQHQNDTESTISSGTGHPTHETDPRAATHNKINDGRDTQPRSDRRLPGILTIDEAVAQGLVERPASGRVARFPDRYGYDPVARQFVRNADPAALPVPRERPSSWEAPPADTPASTRRDIDRSRTAAERAIDRQVAIRTRASDAERCVAAVDHGEAPFTRSGEIGSDAARYPDFQSRDSTTMQNHAQEIGHRLQDGGCNDFNGQGSAASVHCEKQAAVIHPGEPIGVALPMCRDCRNAFRNEAVAGGRDLTVTDPDMSRVFHSDGSVTEYRPDGTVYRGVVGTAPY